MSQLTILIVGGAGYIGSHVNKMLNLMGYHTIVVDNLSRGSIKTVLHGTFVQGDLCDPLFLNQLFQKYTIDAVMHFAAYIDVGESVVNPAKYYQNNVVNTLNLLTAMVKSQVKTFIFSSTAAIFGYPLSNKIAESHPCHPINPYGETKWVAEKMLRDFEQAYGLKYSCLRYFNAAGGDPEGKIKNYQTKSSNLIPLILKSLQHETKSITIYGTDYATTDGTCIRDYIHIQDLGHAHIKALEQLFNGSSSTSYNLGNGNGFSVKEVIQTVEKVLNKKVSFIEGARRPGDPPILLADTQKAASLLNWHPQFSLAEMIKHAWTAYH
ncbi:UDP-glucose 4-epimerase GalE [Candidatus Protochlamydia sp. R18]|uniref:UDP-glucose 4-epimerase GalE n=1 Tax=Candidatus Protochlamydia sp. R18 TaxID=1353977 RepID=UPI0005AA8F11|nr:UDP-glucose 4-epimerase GalE [Candidatus Protochlamydia sp. R18]